MMVVSIKEKLLKIKPLLAPFLEKEAYFIVALLVVVSGGAFAAGRMAPTTSGGGEAATALKPTMRVLPGSAGSTERQSSGTTSTTTTQAVAPAEASGAKNETKGMYVGSRKGAKYHLPSCAGAQHISAANKVWFSSKEDAAAKGYTPASNCKGI